MSNVVTLDTEVKKLQASIYFAIKTVNNLSKTTVTRKAKNDFSKIYVSHEQAYVPDFELEWCTAKKHFRIYMLQGYTNQPKIRRGFCIATINGPLAAVDFVQMYKFLHKHRANNKEAAFEQVA